MLFLINGDEDGINKNDRTEPEQLAVEKAKAYHGWNHYWWSSTPNISSLD